jgi:acyl phosphate:glycerol-3-phosphate acyltransferase
VNWALAAIFSYLLGSISFSYLMGKLGRGIDIRKHGSGNAGATNTLRVLGVGPAIMVLALDIAKGVLAVWIGRWMDPGNLWLAVACGFAVVIGHNWPIFFAFRGGKGIATTIGAVATLCFVPGVVAGAIGIISIFFTRYVSLGSLLFAGLLPFSLLLFHADIELVLFSIAIAVLAYYRHRSNIVKIVKGKENKIAFRRSQG